MAAIEKIVQEVEKEKEEEAAAKKKDTKEKWTPPTPAYPIPSLLCDQFMPAVSKNSW